MGGQWRACAVVVLFCALTAGCATDADSGIECDLPDDAVLVAAPDGGMQVEWPNGTTAMLSFANGTCVFRTTPGDYSRAELSRDELAFTYDYYRQSLAPCLDNLGFRILAPPTRQAFIESDGNWSPYDSVFTGFLDSEEIGTIEHVCPQAPPKH